ncbi:MAG: altronate dehydratase family protein [Ruthenibacterium sp.]
MKRTLQNHPKDTVAVVLEAVRCGESAETQAGAVCACEDVPFGHKIALKNIRKGDAVLRFCTQIGIATQDIPAGAQVHTENLVSTLQAENPYTYCPQPSQTEKPLAVPASFKGFIRPDGGVGIRNEIWILPTVGCVNGIVRQLEKLAQPFVQENLDGIYAFTHPFGCSQRGEDLEMLLHTLAGLVQNPNAGGVLLVGLGCENSTIEKLLKQIPKQYHSKIATMECRACSDELAVGTALLRTMAVNVRACVRTPAPLSSLHIGLNCGASDFFSGLLANPVLSEVSDSFVAGGAGVILTEMCELMGSEYQLLHRCRDKQVFARAPEIFEKQRHYFAQHGESCYPPLSAQACEQGITTIEEKSMCFAQKGGTSCITGVLAAGEQAQTGLQLLNAPGNDLVSTTLLAASGAQLVLFSTGRGTPFGGPVPTFKLASNHFLAREKQNWVDWDCGALLTEGSVRQMSEPLLQKLMREINGDEKSKNEWSNLREIAILKNGITH